MPSRRTRFVALATLVVLLGLGAVFLRVPRHEPAGEREAEAGETPEGPADWFYAQRAAPDGSIPEERFAASLAQARMERSRSRASAYATSALAWQNVGPYNIGGRVTALAVAGSTIYLGSANGGVWKSVNAGVNWTCVTDNYPFFSVGALALDPSNPGTVYCGSGEANGSIDSYDGNGLWRTQDGGATWANLGLTTTGRIARVLVDPANPNHVLVAAMGRQFSTSNDRGLYRTLDGGLTWNRVLYVSDSTGVTDLVMNPVHPDTMYCATWERVRRLTYRRTSGPESGVWRSVDRGATWARLGVGLPTPTDSVGRIALAVAPSRPSTVYAQVTGGASLNYSGVGFYRSLDGGSTWALRTAASPWSTNFASFAWYFGDIGVDPVNPDHAWSLGVNLGSTSDAGASWALNFSPHADQHAIWVDPANSNHFYIGNDGGFYWSFDGSSFTRSFDLPISQFYDGEVHPTIATTIYGGTQDNSTIMTTSGPGNWITTLGGDGFHVLVDPVDPNIVFEEYQYCSGGFGFLRSTTGGPGPGGTNGWATSERFGWDTPICINPRNHNLLLAGSQHVYRSTDNGMLWAKISNQDMSTNPLTQGVVFGCITTLAISNADTSVYYVGTDDGNVWRSANRGANWTSIKAGLPGRWVTRVVPDPADPQVVYVSLSGFTTDQQAALVYRSSNQGGTWTNISGNLPNVPANDLVVDPADTQTLFLASDLGVWVSRNQGAGWYALGDGLPLQSIFDLTLQASTRQLFAFTHGRSAWRLDLAALPPASVPPAPPQRLALTSPWPNPAPGAVRMSLETARDATAEVVIYDIVGRRVSTLHEGPLAAGRHELRWDRRDARGQRAGAGVYFVRAVSGGATRTQRLVLVD